MNGMEPMEIIQFTQMLEENGDRSKGAAHGAQPLGRGVGLCPKGTLVGGVMQRIAREDLGAELGRSCGWPLPTFPA